MKKCFNLVYSSINLILLSFCNQSSRRIHGRSHIALSDLSQSSMFVLEFTNKKLIEKHKKCILKHSTLCTFQGNVFSSVDTTEHHCLSRTRITRFPRQVDGNNSSFMALITCCFFSLSGYLNNSNSNFRSPSTKTINRLYHFKHIVKPALRGQIWGKEKAAL